MQYISSTTIDFLKAIAINNNRDWFNNHKNDYQKAYENLCLFIDDLIHLMNLHDELETNSGKKSLYRIYNDVRFSKDKSPYKTHFAFSLKRASVSRRGGYYLRLSPGNSFLACGFFAPNPDDLLLIRKDIQYHYSDWNTLLKLKNLQQNFGSLSGEKVKTVPKGFDKNLDGIDLIRHKQFILKHPFSDLEITSPHFLTQVNSTFQSVRPFFDYMSQILTSNFNGESII